MTDKEIIIDGVDVSECEFLWKEKLPRKICNNGNLDCDCNSNINCIFRRLKAKEQEYEELKEDRERWKSNFNGKVSAIEELLQQLDQFKAKEQECKNLEEELRGCRIGIKDISIENTEICKISEKYKRALDEIEKLLPKFDTSDGCSYGDYDCENCSDLDEDIVCAYKLKKVIKGIINEVKEK